MPTVIYINLHVRRILRATNMNPFLHQVASFLYQRYGSDINNLVIVFPGRRSSVFFNAYLNSIIEKPILGPETTTINELVSRLSGLQTSDQTGMIMSLYKIYIEETGHFEELDDFFFWGEILLNDFNDVDKYLLNADDLFRNISDLKEIDLLFDYLTEEQKKAAKMFWGDFGRSGLSVNREKFLEIWKKLPAVYNRFKTTLLSEESGYNGMIYRHLGEQLDSGTIPDDNLEHYVFVGFNALNKCEKKLFQYLQKRGKADFIWDYDRTFIDNPTHEAGMFIRENIINFPEPEGYTADAKQYEKKIRIVSVPGQVTQAQIVNQEQFLPTRFVDEKFDDTALVLADENLLIPVISATGSHSQDINITMGYPLRDSPVYSLLIRLISLYQNCREMNGELVFYFKPALAVLNHQLLVGTSARKQALAIQQQNRIYVSVSEMSNDDLLKLIFQKKQNWREQAEVFLAILKKLALRYTDEEDAGLEPEHLYQAYIQINRLIDTLVNYHSEQITVPLFFRILIRSLQSVSIPFEGEPLSGLQIMGLLETRTLDFKRVIVFSANEGKLPKSSSAHSFIPYNLRKIFGLPAYEEEDAMYAYYFYRLIHRAEDVVLVYDSSTDGTNTGEMSRYLLQLIYGSKVEPEIYHLDLEFKASHSSPIEVRSTQSYQHRLLDMYSETALSPSALNTYLNCKLSFYFRYLAGLREADEVSEDVDPRLFGNLFHHAAEKIYSEFKGKKPVSKADIESILKNQAYLGKVINAAFAKEYYRDENLKDIKLTGENILIAGNLLVYIEKMLNLDMQFTPFTILDTEGKYVADFHLKVDGKMQKIKLGGTIDRIDRTNNGIRIIDYKTGRNVQQKFINYEDFYNIEKEHRPKEIFQTLIYSEIYTRRLGKQDIYPTIYKIDNFFNDFHPEITCDNRIVNYPEIADTFLPGLEQLLSEIISSEQIYEQTPVLNHCRTCSYQTICRRR